MSADSIYCGKMQKEREWSDGRYMCDKKAGHAGPCGSWSRSSSGRVTFKGYERCACTKSGCNCVGGEKRTLIGSPDTDNLEAKE